MAMLTYNRPDIGKLAYEHQEVDINLVYNQNSPAIEMELQHGQFRELNQRANILERDAVSANTTIAKTFSVGDALRNYNITGISNAFEYWKGDLGQSKAYGKKNGAAMIRQMQNIISMGLKKIKEKDYYSQVTTNGNFEGATYYANAVTPWSSTGLANMKDDVTAGRLIVRGLNAMTISETASIYAETNATLNASTLVSGPDRGASVDPNPTTEFLRKYFGMTYFNIAAGDFIDDSSDPTDNGSTEIWGDTALLRRFNPSASKSEMIGEWIKHLFFRADGKGEPQEGWNVIETISEEEGGVGMRKIATWDFYQFLVQEKSYAYRIDALY